LAVKIAGTAPRSPAERLGIKAGWLLLEINGNEINDILDYRFYSTARSLKLAFEDESGARVAKSMKKAEYAEPGLEFETYLMAPQQSCRNKCVFCFIDQLPPGLRETLYFKDDDSRMGFLFGNYVTLTNLKETDIDRIIKMRTSPVNISVHTMNPELRVKMMKNPRAGEVLGWIKRLVDSGIKVNAQLVLCPGINDGAELARSLKELSALAPGLQSVAVVPVGLTKHRANLPELRLFTSAEAAAVIAETTAFASQNLREHGSRICFAADEFYLNADIPMPAYGEYEDFAQLENGVGLTALLRHEFLQALKDEEPRPLFRRVTLATGVSAAPEMRRLCALAEERFPGLSVDVIAVKNEFLGETITVAGLVTAGDLIKTLKREGYAQEVLFPAVMLRRERDIFLDGPAPEDVERELGAKLVPVENDGFELLDAILGKE
jgi:putative radical SAM enzyme (TIGR03279 family)